MKENTIYTWQYDDSLQMINVLQSMESDPNRLKYDPITNAQNIARLFMYGLPGNTLDIILDKIAIDIKAILLNNPDVLSEDYYIQNLIRFTLNNLANIE